MGFLSEVNRPHRDDITRNAGRSGSSKPSVNKLLAQALRESALSEGLDPDALIGVYSGSEPILDGRDSIFSEDSDSGGSLTEDHAHADDSDGSEPQDTAPVVEPVDLVATNALLDRMVASIVDRREPLHERFAEFIRDTTPRTALKAWHTLHSQLVLFRQLVYKNKVIDTSGAVKPGPLATHSGAVGHAERKKSLMFTLDDIIGDSKDFAAVHLSKRDVWNKGVGKALLAAEDLAQAIEQSIKEFKLLASKAGEPAIDKMLLGPLADFEQAVKDSWVQRNFNVTGVGAIPQWMRKIRKALGGDVPRSRAELKRFKAKQEKKAEKELEKQKSKAKAEKEKERAEAKRSREEQRQWEKEEKEREHQREMEKMAQMVKLSKVKGGLPDFEI